MMEVFRMRKKSRLVSLILALGILLSLCVPTVSADTLSFSDVPADSTYYVPIMDLVAEGIINGFEDGTFKPDDPVTRAQFTKIICYALNVGSIQYSESDRAKFPDVDPDHWAIDNITTARNSGIINGYDDGTFKPEEYVLYEQAVKMTVCALGYTEERAIRESGTQSAYPYGYLNLATKAKLLNKITGAKIGEPLTRGRVARLIDNMLNAETFDSETGKTGSTLKETTSSRMSVEGRIVAIYGSSIYYNETSKCNKKQIELELSNGDREFYGIEGLGNININDYLGKSVVIYYEEEAGVDYYEAYKIAEQSKRNAEYKINIDDIEDITGTSVEYWSEEEQDTEKISIDSGNLIVIHNGQAVNDDLEDLINTYSSKTGYVTFLCSLSSDTADIAFVRTYETIYVGTAKDTKNYKIYDYFDSSKSFVLDEEDKNKTITFTKDGKASSFAGITTACVVSVSTSKNGKFIDVQISTTTKSGTITDVLNGNKIKIDATGDTAYKFTDSCHDSGELIAGSYVKLYLDAFGRVGRYVITSASSYTFGYLSAAEDGSSLDPKVELMIYKTSNSNSSLTGTVYSLKENVKIDGKVYKVSSDSDKIMDLLRSTASKAGVNVSINGTAPENVEFAQPIRFTTSSGTVIDSLLTSNSTGDNSVSLNMSNNTSTPLLCRATGTTLDKYNIESSHIILVPSDRTGGTYMTKSASYFKKGENYYVQLANVPSTNKPAVVYVYGTATAGSSVGSEVLSEDNVPMIVTNISTAIKDENGVVFDEAKTCFTLVDVTKGVDASIKVYDDDRDGTDILSTVAEGDIIRVAVDSDKMIDAVEIVAIGEKIVSGTQAGFVKVDGTSDSADIEAPYRVVLGLAHNATSGTLVMAPSFDYPTDKTIENFTYTDSVKVYKIDMDKVGKNSFVEECAFNEIVGLTSKVMVYTNDGDVVAMIIFE